VSSSDAVIQIHFTVGAWRRSRSNGRHDDFDQNWQIRCQILPSDFWGGVRTDQGSLWSN